MPEERRAAERRTKLRRTTDRKVTTGSRLDVILDVTRRLMSITDLDALLRDMAEATTQLLDSDRATIFIVDREGTIRYTWIASRETPQPDYDAVLEEAKKVASGG